MKKTKYILIIILFTISTSLLGAQGFCEEPGATDTPVETIDTSGAPAVAQDVVVTPEGETDTVVALRKDLAKTKEQLDFVTTELRMRAALLDDRVKETERKLSEDVSSQLRKSSWASRIRWGGDVRLRFQKEFFDELNYDSLYDPDKNKIVNTTVDRSRYRYRVRLDAEADIMDKNTENNRGEIDVGARLSTGSMDDPVSSNETLGDSFTRDTLAMDAAYLKWKFKPNTPKWGMIPQVAVTGGKFANPFFYTDLVWDKDVSFEGIAMTFESDTLLENPFKGFITLGVFPVQELELSARDKWLLGAQLGVKYESPLGLSAKVAASYYGFKRTTGEFFNDPSGTFSNDTDPIFRQTGNALFDINTDATKETWALAGDYRLINYTAELDYARWFPVHIILSGDYVKNVGFDSKAVAERMNMSDYPDETKGYQAGITVGYPVPRGFGEWNVSLAYKYLGADAVMDAFADSDFWLGGTNARGWTLGWQYGLSERFWLTGRWVSTNEIRGVPIAVDRLLLDLNVRF
jgi:hypothetical protein